MLFGWERMPAKTCLLKKHVPLEKSLRRRLAGNAEEAGGARGY